jgi:2-polyprenyl-6-methoxyphenol hydroxylase-like FAD-dependent oxidoreductase
MKITIVGGGIAGLSFALNLHSRGIDCEVYEAVPDIKEIGVGITLLPHATAELSKLGVLEQLEPIGIENLESVFFNRYGQFVYKELRGRHAGYSTPELGIHRGKLHKVLFDAATKRLGPAKIHTGFKCTGFKQNADEHSDIELQMEHVDKSKRLVSASTVVACDGVNSAIRKQLYPDDRVVFAGINTWRGVTVHKPILSGKSYLRIGSIETGKMVIYPIIDNVDGLGNQLINWVAEIQEDQNAMNDWNRPGKLEDFLPTFAKWRYDWLDVTQLISGATQILEYPMVDKNPLPQWTFGAVTLMGDAAHPMYPRGSNGSAQAIIDARTLADCLKDAFTSAGATRQTARQALKDYETKRLETTAKVVTTNRTLPPDAIIMKADELSKGQPFVNIDDLISQDELRQISDNYKKIAGFALKPA